MNPKERERRQVVFLQASMRSQDGWSDVTIGNISSRGLMVKTSSPPPRGAFVELRRGHACIVGHVRWSQGVRFGIRSQDLIDTDALLDDLALKPQARGIERRMQSRDARNSQARTALKANEEQSRLMGRVMDWGPIMLAGLVVAGLIAEVATTSLSVPLEKASAALEGHQ